MIKLPIFFAALLSIPGVGRQTALHIFEEFHAKNVSPIETWGKKAWLKVVKKSVSVRVLEEIERFQTAWSIDGYEQYLHEKHIEVLLYQDARYPVLLREIHDFPLVLFTKGNLECLRPHHVAVVGSRRPTRYGLWATQHLVSQFVASDVGIVSGFMVGIDYQAHSIAQALSGRSVGVLGFGFDHFYPSHLQSATRTFLEAGQLLVTEYPPDVAPAAGQFAARNRIVAGMSFGTVVAEAHRESGSLITAQCAVDNGRVVGAVPGPIDSALSEGTHHLIREGAILMSSAQDMLLEFSPGAEV